MCEQLVTERLKSPGTADFQRPDVAPAVAPDTWIVSGSVDAQNGFGALVRIDYECTVQADGDGMWTLLALKHQQR